MPFVSVLSVCDTFIITHTFLVDALRRVTEKFLGEIGETVYAVA